ncbi:MAG: AMP-binding protein [Actinobacteria bacterium]|nr:AMP-binding protein [Actinomycetota bacterium]
MPRPDYDRPGGPWDVPPLSRLPRSGVVDGDTILDPDEVDRRVGLVAAGLSTRGVRLGDRVAWQLPNWWEAVVLYRACWRIGAVAVPIHHRVGPVTRQVIVDRVRPRVTLVASDLGPPDDAIEVRGEGDGFGALLDGAPRGHPSRSRDSAPAPPNDAVILATSGSSGVPKLVRHTHRGLAYKARAMVGAHGLDTTDAILMPAPLSHISGLLNGVLIPGAGGLTTVVEDRWDPDRALELISSQRVTFMIGPPTFFIDLMAADAFSPGRVAPLRLVSCGGAGVTPAFVEEARERLGAVVKRTYGSTEAPTVTTSHADDPLDRARDTDGRPVGAAELRVAGGREGAGRLQVRGPELFVGYLDAAAPIDEEGWYDTGDLARLDDEWVTILGRADDTIVRGGENISPGEVEAVCACIPGVRQAIVVGYPDQRLGQRIGLVIEAETDVGLDTITRACEAAGLARFKTPERVVRLDIVPRLDAGKPDRRALSELLAAR